MRRRRGWTQRDLAALAGVSRGSVSVIERGHVDTLSLRTLRRVFGAVEARFDGAVSWRGGEVDRLLDAKHAALVEALVAELSRFGWSPLTEVSFNHYGDRGSIDVLAVHLETRSGLVSEVKSDLFGVEETSRRLDVKVRIAPALIEERFGIRPVAVGRLLVLPRSSTAWRRVQSVRETMGVTLPARTLEVRQWLRRPRGTLAGIAFVSPATPRSVRSRTRSP